MSWTDENYGTPQTWVSDGPAVERYIAVGYIQEGYYETRTTVTWADESAPDKSWTDET